MNWQLKSLNITFMEWGEFKGNYVGKIEFTDGSNNAFTFQLSTEETAKYLEVIAAKIGKSASELGQKVIESLKFLPAPGQPTIQLEAKELQS